MRHFTHRKITKSIYRAVSIFVTIAFVSTSIVPPTYAQSIPLTVLNLPVPGTMVSLTPVFTPPMVNGITIHPEDPFRFNFLVGKGDNNLEGEEFIAEADKLIKYFLASLTVPEEELWVNLSPYEKDRIIPDSLSRTEMGRDLLAQDYILKQLTASLMYPEDELGKKFWDRIYAKVRQEHGITEVPVDTLNKVWIVPQEATVYETENSAIVIGSYLKVMLESDYLAMANAKDHNPETVAQSSPSAAVIKEVIIPEIEREVNEGATFAPLRQIYNSMILATWYKKNLRESLLGQVYVDQNKIAGIDTVDAGTKDEIYDQYLKAFKVGVYNYIKEDIDPMTQAVTPRKYFAGGITAVKADNISSPVANDPNTVALATARLQDDKTIEVKLIGDRGQDLAAGSSPVSEEAQDILDALDRLNKFEQLNSQAYQEFVDFIRRGAITIDLVDSHFADLFKSNALLNENYSVVSNRAISQAVSRLDGKDSAKNILDAFEDNFNGAYQQLVAMANRGMITIDPIDSEYSKLFTREGLLDENYNLRNEIRLEIELRSALSLAKEDSDSSPVTPAVSPVTVDSIRGRLNSIATRLDEELAGARGVTEPNRELVESLERRIDAINQNLSKLSRLHKDVEPTLISAISALDPVKDSQLREELARIWADYVDGRVQSGFGQEAHQAVMAQRRANLAQIPMKGPDISDLSSVMDYIAQEADMYKPAKIVIVDASNKEQIARLREQALAEGSIYEGDDGNYGSNSHPQDTARAIGPTSNASRDSNDAGFFNNWKDSRETLIKMMAKTTGQYKGKTMYVIATVAGNPNRDTAFPVIQTTDSLGAIVMQYLTLYNLNGELVGQVALDKIRRENGRFLKISHATGDLDNVRRAGDAVIEDPSGTFRRLNKAQRFVVKDGETSVMVNLPNEKGELETSTNAARIARLTELSAGNQGQTITLAEGQSARIINDNTDDRSFVLFTSEHDGSNDFVDQYGSEEVRTVFSAYGGNGIGAKKFVLRLAILKAMRSLNLGMAHAYLSVYRDKKTGETFGIMGRFPSLVGKSNAGLGEVADALADEWETYYGSDDLVFEDFRVATLSEGEQITDKTIFDEVVGFNTEGGAFLVAPGISDKELRMAMESFKYGGGLSVNLAYRFYVDPQTDRTKVRDYWWEGHDRPAPVVEIVEEFFQARDGALPKLTGWHDWKKQPAHQRLNGVIPTEFNDREGLLNDLRAYVGTKNRQSVQLQYPELVKNIVAAFEGNGKELAHPNSRFSVRSEMIPSWIGHDQHPLPAATIEMLEHRVDIDEVSGRRPDTMPLVIMFPNKMAGLYKRIFNWSQGTAAEEGAEGTLFIDPDALKPFMPTRLGPYVEHQIDRTQRLRDGARVVSQVNPFVRGRNPDGTYQPKGFLYPGFKENSRFRVWEIKLLREIRRLIKLNEVDNVIENVEYLRSKLDPSEYQVHDLGWILPSMNSSIFDGMDIPEKDRIRLTTVNAGEYKDEILRNTYVMLGTNPESDPDFVKKFGNLNMDVPDALRREHERQAAYFGVQLPQAWYDAPSWESEEAKRTAAASPVEDRELTEAEMIAVKEYISGKIALGNVPINIDEIFKALDLPKGRKSMTQVFVEITILTQQHYGFPQTTFFGTIKETSGDPDNGSDDSSASPVQPAATSSPARFSRIEEMANNEFTMVQTQAQSVQMNDLIVRLNEQFEKLFQTLRRLSSSELKEHEEVLVKAFINVFGEDDFKIFNDKVRDKKSGDLRQLFTIAVNQAGSIQFNDDRVPRKIRKDTLQSSVYEVLKSYLIEFPASTESKTSSPVEAVTTAEELGEKVVELFFKDLKLWNEFNPEKATETILSSVTKGILNLKGISKLYGRDKQISFDVPVVVIGKGVRPKTKKVDVSYSTHLRVTLTNDGNVIKFSREIKPFTPISPGFPPLAAHAEIQLTGEIAEALGVKAASPVEGPGKGGIYGASSPLVQAEIEEGQLRKGGIDLDSDHMNLEVKRDGNGVPLPVFMQPMGIININGLVPVILNVAPVNLPIILGSAYTPEEEPLADTEADHSLDSARNVYFDRMINEEASAVI